MERFGEVSLLEKDENSFLFSAFPNPKKMGHIYYLLVMKESSIKQFYARAMKRDYIEMHEVKKGKRELVIC